MATARKTANPKAPETAKQDVGEALYTALTPISHGSLDEHGQRVSKVYQVGDTLTLDDDQAAVLLRRKAIELAADEQAPE